MEQTDEEQRQGHTGGSSKQYEMAAVEKDAEEAVAFMREHGKRETREEGDHNCCFRAISAEVGMGSSGHREVRKMCVDRMRLDNLATDAECDAMQRYGCKQGWGDDRALLAATRVFDVTVMVVRQEHRGRGLARQAMQMVQARLGEEVQEGSYSLRAGLKSCMQREGVGLYRALGWRGDGESWEWSSDEHAAQGSTRSHGNLTESGGVKERKPAARYAVEDVGNMPMRETGEVGRDADEQVDEQGAGVDPLDTSRRARQLRLNEQGGKKCICGRWEDYARVDGGWASSRLGGEWGEAGEHGCENVAAGELEMNEKLCLLCQAGPVDECNETGVPVTVRAPPAQRLKGGPARCCDIWDTRCPTCDIGSEKSCFMRCGCGCEGCTVGRVWYAPDEADLFPDRQWVNMSDEEQGGQGEAEEQEEREEEARAEREMQEDMVLGAEGRGAPGEEEELQRSLAEGPGTALALRTAQGAAGRGQETQTAEGKKRSDLEKLRQQLAGTGLRRTCSSGRGQQRG